MVIGFAPHRPAVSAAARAPSRFPLPHRPSRTTGLIAARMKARRAVSARTAHIRKDRGKRGCTLRREPTARSQVGGASRRAWGGVVQAGVGAGTFNCRRCVRGRGVPFAAGPIWRHWIDLAGMGCRCSRDNSFCSRRHRCPERRRLSHLADEDAGFITIPAAVTAAPTCRGPPETSRLNVALAHRPIPPGPPRSGAQATRGRGEPLAHPYRPSRTKIPRPAGLVAFRQSRVQVSHARRARSGNGSGLRD